MRYLAAVLMSFLALSTSLGTEKAKKIVPPDSQSVRWKGPAYRYFQQGWIVLHIEGKPYERGLQHGYLMAEEIAGYLRCFAAQQGSKAPAEAWKSTRTLVNAIFLRRFEKEFLEEMQGIADGASEGGAKFDDRKIDLVDIAALNLWAEIETLDGALEATPTGLEGIRFPKPQPKNVPTTPMDHCSAFAATGSATADGKIVFGHITMFGLYPAKFYNVWLDIKPAEGYRVVMQTYPGGIQSGMDYYLNEKGLVVCETTIQQTKFDVDGMALASRIRKALQYADSIDKAVEILQNKNNGLYTNEWLLGDIKTNEIALLELGTKNTKLMRSSKKEWFANTEGFYWGCNNTKDLQVRLDTIASAEGRPENITWKPSERDKGWLKFYDKYKGKISVENAKEAFTTSPLAAYPSFDAKITTSDLAAKMQSHALFGPPLGNIWEVTDEEKQNYPEIVPLVPNPWTVLTTDPPEQSKSESIKDFHQKLEPFLSPADRVTMTLPDTTPAWYGTLLPKTNLEVWFTTAFAEYERLSALEKEWEKEGKELSPEHERRLAVLRYQHRCHFLRKPLSEKAREPFDLQHDAWVRAETARGIFILDQFRLQIGIPVFEKLMEGFGRKYAGKEVTSNMFLEYLDLEGKGEVRKRFAQAMQLNSPLKFNVEFRVESPTANDPHKEFHITGMVSSQNPKDLEFLRMMEVTVEYEEGETTRLVHVEDGKIKLTLSEKPIKISADRYQRLLTEKGGKFTVTSFLQDIDKTLIVYGTKLDRDAQKEAALRLQQCIRRSWFNSEVRILSDEEVKAEHIRSNHLLLIGSPQTNWLCEQFASKFPVQFQTGSFTLEGQKFAHEGSAIVASATNPTNANYSLVILAGLSAEATFHTPTALMSKGLKPGEVLLLPHQRHAESRVIAK